MHKHIVSTGLIAEQISYLIFIRMPCDQYYKPILQERKRSEAKRCRVTYLLRKLLSP